MFGCARRIAFRINISERGIQECFMNVQTVFLKVLARLATIAGGRFSATRCGSRPLSLLLELEHSVWKHHSKNAKNGCGVAFAKNSCGLLSLLSAGAHVFSLQPQSHGSWESQQVGRFAAPSIRGILYLDLFSAGAWRMLQVVLQRAL